MNILALIVAFIIGGLCGILVMACLNVARAADDTSVQALEEVNMNRDKQIEEMAMLVCRHTMTKMCADGTCPMTWECPLNIKTVEALYDNGYRKAEDVAREIFGEIDKHIQEKKKAISMFKDGEDDFYDGEIHALEVFAHLLAELEKKYTEGER